MSSLLVDSYLGFVGGEKHFSPPTRPGYKASSAGNLYIQTKILKLSVMLLVWFPGPQPAFHYLQ